MKNLTLNSVMYTYQKDGQPDKVIILESSKNDILIFSDLEDNTYTFNKNISRQISTGEFVLYNPDTEERIIPLWYSIGGEKRKIAYSKKTLKEIQELYNKVFKSNLTPTERIKKCIEVKTNKIKKEIEELKEDAKVALDEVLDDVMKIENSDIKGLNYSRR